jgi:hypothetical protein
MNAFYVAPRNPADPAGAALELIVRLPSDPGHGFPPREALQHFAAILDMEGAFAGMSWHDAKHAAVAVIVDALTRDDPAGFLEQRACNALSGRDGMRWDSPAKVARAMRIGAGALR